MKRSSWVYMTWWSPCLALDRVRSSRRVSRKSGENGCTYFLKQEGREHEGRSPTGIIPAELAMPYRGRATPLGSTYKLAEGIQKIGDLPGTPGEADRS